MVSLGTVLFAGIAYIALVLVYFTLFHASGENAEGAPAAKPRTDDSARDD